MLIFSTLVGFAVLLLGRQLFWVAVAGLGFILGLNYATQYYQGSPEMLVLISLGAGLVGAILAYALQRTAAGLVGFLGGWYLTITLINSTNSNLGEYSVILALIGGLIGLSLISILFDWGLILLSSLAGTTMIVQSIQFNTTTNTIIFIILFTLGVVIQGILLSQEKSNFR
jgi:hypothetical protein